MTRRSFLARGLALPLAARPLQSPRGGEWQTFEVVTRLDLPPAATSLRAWVPLPLARDTPFQRLLSVQIDAPGSSAPAQRATSAGAAIAIAAWPAKTTATLAVTVSVEARDHDVVLTAGAAAPAAPRRDDLTRYLQPTRLIPTDGIVREFARRITRGHDTPLTRARAIYEWIVEHTERDPTVQGCGLGDIRWMLETGSLRGKCADLNALFVGLARAAGLPARDLYGLRVAPSRHLASLGRAGGDVTTAQHCRAEVYIDALGWVPVDPADVRKVLLEEPGLRSLAEPRVRAVRDRLFGSWEGNWIAFNDAHDVSLPGSSGGPLPFLMYPQAESDGVRRDSLDPARFRYAITARAVA